jgi:hypothetical protein
MVGSTSPPTSATQQRQTFVLRHQRATLVVWTLLLTVIIALAGEALLRAVAAQGFGYYTGKVVSKRLILYPFGAMPFNDYGYPDREWNLADPRPHVGIWGDSITSGVGAGFGYRFSDLLVAGSPDRYFMNFGGPGEDGVADERAVQKILAIVARFQLSKVIYAMDLNDILPSGSQPAGGNSPQSFARGLLRHQSDALRRHSYLYSYLYTKAKGAAARLGFSSHGAEAVEFHPTRNAKVVAQTVERINGLGKRLTAQGVALCVLIFPYEMQVSKDAAERYKRYGIGWSDEFLNGEPQREILRQLDPGISSIDLRTAFGRGDALIGTYYVFDRGGSLDWVHPNRAGHDLISRFLLANGSQCL